MATVQKSRMVVGFAAGIAAIGFAGFAGLWMGGCHSDDPEGRTKTVSTKVEDTPEGKRTTTYTHEKETKVIDK